MADAVQPAVIIALDEITRARAEATLQLERRIEERTQALKTANDILAREVEQRRLLEQRLVAMLENESRELGQDLHDNIASQLSGIELYCEATLRRVGVASAWKALRIVARLVRNALGDTRRMAHGMAPVPSYPSDLALSLKALAQRTRIITGCRCTVRNYGAPIADPAVALHLYRITQEAIANAARHGAARHLAIVLKSNRAGVQLLIRDDGRGLAADLPDRNGIGLATMKTRAQAMGGSLEVCRNAAGGTDVICWVPHVSAAPAAPYRE